MSEQRRSSMSRSAANSDSAACRPGSQIFIRGDSALYEQAVFAWCEKPERGIGYAISADMSPPLREEIGRLPEHVWQLTCEEPGAIREWVKVPHVPNDGSTVKHFAIVTNREGDDLMLIRWHREKAGTVEHAHYVMRNELAAAALPSGKFGANAAWFRRNVLT